MNFLTGLSATLLVTVMVVAVYGRKSKNADTKGKDVSTGTYNPKLLAEVKIGEIHKSVVMSKSISLGENNTIDRNCRIARDVEIGSLNIFEQNSTVGADVQIGSKNIIGRRSKVQHDAEINSNNKIGSGLNMDHHATIGDGNIIGSDVRMLPHSKVLDNTKIDGYSILDEHSEVGSGSQIGTYVYLGKRSSTGGANIRDRAVVHAYVELSQGATVRAGEVVIPSPSSFELFQQCARFDKVPRNSTSRDINFVLNELLNSQFKQLNIHCRGPSRTKPAELMKMPLIKSLYLIKYYGEEDFKSKYQEVLSIDGGIGRKCSCTGGKGCQMAISIGGISMCGSNSATGNYGYDADDTSGTLVETFGGIRLDRSTTGGNPELHNRIHFGKNAQGEILNPEVKQKFVQALAAELDAERDVRVLNDTFCSMIEQIQSGKRKVTCLTEKVSL